MTTTSNAMNNLQTEQTEMRREVTLFGGISVLLQVFSIATKNNLSIKPYFIGKILQALFSSIYTIIALLFI